MSSRADDPTNPSTQPAIQSNPPSTKCDGLCKSLTDASPCLPNPKANPTINILQ